MAIKATICKATIQITDMDRGYYDDLSLTIAQHPSETDERMMIRILAFILHASESLKFTEAISGEKDEPDIWQKNMTGDIDIWIDLGLPNEKKIKKACNRAKQVFIYSYGGRTVQTWWQPIADKVSMQNNLKVVYLPQKTTQSLIKLAQKSMTLHCTIQDKQIWIGDDTLNILVEPEILYSGIKG